MLASDPVFRKVYEAFDQHDERVTIVTTKSHDALSAICAVAAINATHAIYINCFEYQRAIGVTNCIPKFLMVYYSCNSILRTARKSVQKSLLVARHPTHTIPS